MVWARTPRAPLPLRTPQQQHCRYEVFKILIIINSDYSSADFVVGPYSILIQILFVISMVFVPIVLLNLLIALISDSFERIQDRAQMELTFLRAKIVVELELFLSPEE